MNIGEAARASGLSAKMIRYYESVGLVSAPARTEAGYRSYGPCDVHILRFVRRARDLGFSVAEVRGLVGLWQDQDRKSADVKQIALDQIALLEERARGLQAMAETLRTLADSCAGDARPDCPILIDLETGDHRDAAPALQRFGGAGERGANRPRAK